MLPGSVTGSRLVLLSPLVRCHWGAQPLTQSMTRIAERRKGGMPRSANHYRKNFCVRPLGRRSAAPASMRRGGATSEGGVIRKVSRTPRRFGAGVSGAERRRGCATGQAGAQATRSTRPISSPIARSNSGSGRVSTRAAPPRRKKATSSSKSRSKALLPWRSVNR